MRAARARRKGVFACGILQRGSDSGTPGTLSAGIKRLQRAIEALPADDPARTDFVDVLAKATWRKFELTGALPDLDLVVDARRQAVAAGPPDSSLSARQHNLANALRIRFERTQLPPDIEAAVDAARRGMALLGDDDPRRPQGLSLLGLVLALRFGQAGEVADVDEAVQVGQEAADLAVGDAGRSGILTNLANALLRRYERLEAPSDLERAIDASQEACRTACQAPRRSLRSCAPGSGLTCWSSTGPGQASRAAGATGPHWRPATRSAKRCPAIRGRTLPATPRTASTTRLPAACSCTTMLTGRSRC